MSNRLSQLQLRCWIENEKIWRKRKIIKRNARCNFANYLLYKCEITNNNRAHYSIQIREIIFKSHIRNFWYYERKFFESSLAEYMFEKLFFSDIFFFVETWNLKEKKTVSIQMNCLNNNKLVYASSQITRATIFFLLYFLPLFLPLQKVSTEMSKSGFNLWNCHRKQFICAYLFFYFMFFFRFDASWINS